MSAIPPAELEEIKQRVRRYYAAYAPQNVERVDYIVQLYKGKERQIMADMIKKYNLPEPDGSTAPAAAASPPPAAAPTQPSTPSPANAGGSVVSEQQQPQQQVGSLAPSSSFIRQPEQQQQQQQPQQQVLALQQQQVMQQPQPIAAPPPTTESYDLLRESVKDNIGFRSVALQRAWEDAWMGKIPLGNYRKAWQGARSVIHEGYGWKLTVRAKPVHRWQRRYFVLVPNFLYYFDTDDAMSPAKGAVFMDRATVKQSTVKDKKALVISSHFHKKPLELNADGDYSTFTISFDAPKVQTVWQTLLTKISAIVAPTDGAAAAPATTTTTVAVGGGAAATPMISLQEMQLQALVQQQQLQLQQQQQLLLQQAQAPITPTRTPRVLSSPRVAKYGCDNR